MVPDRGLFPPPPALPCRPAASLPGHRPLPRPQHRHRRLHRPPRLRRRFRQHGEGAGMGLGDGGHAGGGGSGLTPCLPPATPSQFACSRVPLRDCAARELNITPAAVGPCQLRALNLSLGAPPGLCRPHGLACDFPEVSGCGVLGWGPPGHGVLLGCWCRAASVGPRRCRVPVWGSRRCRVPKGAGMGFLRV